MFVDTALQPSFAQPRLLYKAIASHEKMLKDINSIVWKLQGNKSDPLYPVVRDIHDRLSKSMKIIQHTLQWKDTHVLQTLRSSTIDLLTSAMMYSGSNFSLTCTWIGVCFHVVYAWQHCKSGGWGWAPTDAGHAAQHPQTSRRSGEERVWAGGGGEGSGESQRNRRRCRVEDAM